MARKAKKDVNKAGGAKKGSKKGDAKKGRAKNVRETVHEIYLAGLGAIATVGEGGAKLAHDAIEQGRKLAKAGKKKGKKRVEGAEANVEAFAGWVDGRVQGVLERMGVPSRSEVQGLSERLESLVEKVSSLETPATTTVTRPPTTSAKKKASKSPKAVSSKTASAKATSAGSDVTTFHVSKHSDGWQVVRDGETSPLATERTKKAAMEQARAAAKAAEPSQVVAHRVDGSVQARSSYGVS